MSDPYDPFGGGAPFGQPRMRGYGGTGTPSYGSAREEELALLLEVAEQKLRALQQGHALVGVVLSVLGDSVVVSAESVTLEMKRPAHIAGILSPGATVLFSSQDGKHSITNVLGWTPPGDVHRVSSVLPSVGGQHVAIVGTMRGEQTVLSKDPVKAGDRVVVDRSVRVVLRNLGRGDDKDFYSGDANVSWDDVVGLEEAKEALREAIIDPVLHKDVYERFGARRSKGVLLFGSPGNGKTYITRAAAAEVAKLHAGKGGKPGFLYKKGPEILDKYVGASEANIRALFAAARDHQEKHGVPAVIFLDEADAVLGKRGVMRGLEGMERTTVPQFLAEMDGLDDSGAFLIVATNRPDDLDPAVTRDGRIDRKIRVSRPGPEEIRRIVALNLRGRPIDGSADALGEIVAEAVKKEPSLADVKIMIEGKEEKMPLLLSHAVTGSMLAALSDRATRRAMRRAVELSEKRKKSSDVKVEGDDLLAALSDAVRELGRTDLWGALLELEHDTGGRIVGIERRKVT